MLNECVNTLCVINIHYRFSAAHTIEIIPYFIYRKIICFEYEYTFKIEY